MRSASVAIALAILASCGEVEACSPLAPMSPREADGNAFVPDWSLAKYAFIGKVVERSNLPKEAPTIELDIIDSWNGELHNGERAVITFVRFRCPGAAVQPAGIDLDAFPVGTRVRVISNHLTLSPDRVGWELTVLGGGT